MGLVSRRVCWLQAGVSASVDISSAFEVDELAVSCVLAHLKAGFVWVVTMK